MKLWLDDERDPSDPKIKELFGSEGDEVWVKVADEAIHYLEQGGVESISLDHDLGPPSAGTGYDVAKFIEEQAFHGKLARLTWSVHSKSIVGRRAIAQAMMNAEKFWNNSPQSPQ